MPLSDLWADRLTNLLLNTAGAPAGLPTLYLQAYLTIPAPDGTGGVIPASADGYTGPVDVHGATYWPDSTGGVGSSLQAADIGFGTPTADWGGPIRGVAFVQSDGTLFTEAQEFDDPLDVVVGTPVVVPAASVAFQVI